MCPQRYHGGETDARRQPETVICQVVLLIFKRTPHQPCPVGTWGCRSCCLLCRSSSQDDLKTQKMWSRDKVSWSLSSAGPVQLCRPVVCNGKDSGFILSQGDLKEITDIVKRIQGKDQHTSQLTGLALRVSLQVQHAFVASKCLITCR